jgi:hypothetical protein
MCQACSSHCLHWLFSHLYPSFTGSIVLKIAYGYTTKEKDDPFIISADELLRELSLIISLDTWPWMVDLFPFCKWLILDYSFRLLELPSLVEKLPHQFPGTRFKKLATQWSNHLQEFIDRPIQVVKEQIVSSAKAVSV